MYRILLCAAAALFIASQAEAQTSTPALIYACVNNGNGTIHVVAPNQACQTNEISLICAAQRITAESVRHRRR